MLYLNSVENAAASKTGKKYAICHETVPAMQNVTELAPSKQLLTQWESQEISWNEFRNRFIAEMRSEYRREESRLKKLTKYSLKHDVTLHSPEPSGKQTYRAILEVIINTIWDREGRTDRVINLAGGSSEARLLTEAARKQMERIAATCELFSPVQLGDRARTCQHCKRLDRQVYMCSPTNRVVVDYEWITPIPLPTSQRL